MSQSYGFYLSQWEKNKLTILNLRKNVLTGSPDQALQSAEDADSYHVIAYGDEEPIGAGSMTQDGFIKNIVVLDQWRRRTVGKAIVLYLLNISKVKNLPCMIVSSPQNALGFFESLEFEKTDVTEVKHGIRYHKMVRMITKPGFH